jgi:prevent-host-death family protein
MIVNMHEAKTHLSRLVERAANGEEIIIGNAGKPRARLVAYEQRRAPRTPGSMKGKVSIAEDFDDTPDDILDAFEGRT